VVVVAAVAEELFPVPVFVEGSAAVEYDGGDGDGC